MLRQTEVLTAKIKNNVAGADVKFNGSLNESSVNDATLNAVVADDKVYFKTDVIEKLAQSSDNAKIKALALIVKSDVWYSIDLNKALTSLGVPNCHNKYSGQCCQRKYCEGYGHIKECLSDRGRY